MLSDAPESSMASALVACADGLDESCRTLQLLVTNAQHKPITKTQSTFEFRSSTSRLLYFGFFGRDYLAGGSLQFDSNCFVSEPGCCSFLAEYQV